MTQGARAFIQAVNDFLFLEDAPEQADILFVPGSRWPGNALRVITVGGYNDANVYFDRGV